MFENPFSFTGRIRRLEYGLSYVFASIYNVFCELAVEYFGMEEYFAFIFTIPALWFLYAQGAKRCHDRGNSGWYQIIPFYILWLLFGDGEYGENDYGLNPKGLGNTKVEDMIDGIGNFKEDED